MTDGLWTIDGMDVEGQRVLLRTDFDVPLAPAYPGRPRCVADDSRIQAALPTVEELRRRGARLILASHLDTPDEPNLSMRPVADRLANLTGAPVRLASGVIGPQVREETERLLPGEMLMLENLRLELGETRNDPGLSSALAELADLYVNDAFRVSHRAHASIEGVAHRLPCAAGRLVEREVAALTAIVDMPVRPLVAVIGGAGLDDKIGIIRRFLEVADAVCIGGAVCLPFLAVEGYNVARSLASRADLELAQQALSVGAARLELPDDLVLANWGEEGRGTARTLDASEVRHDWLGCDIGPHTAANYATLVASAATVFWSGAMGRFEHPALSAGTRAIADAVASTSAMTVTAGDQTVRALQSLGLEDRVNYVSTGGTATLWFLEGRMLPGIEALLRVPVAAR